MSNRNKWAHWRDQKPKNNPYMKYVVGLPLFVLGILLVWSGIQGTRDNVMWFYHFSARWGTMVISPTWSLIVIGSAFVIAGASVLILPD